MARTQRWQAAQPWPGGDGLHGSGESFAEIPNVGFPFEGSDGEGRECVRRRPRRKTRSRKGPFPPFFPEDGCVYGMRGADGGDVGGGARPGGRGGSSPLRHRWWGAPQGASVFSRVGDVSSAGSERGQFWGWKQRKRTGGLCLVPGRTGLESETHRTVMAPLGRVGASSTRGRWGAAGGGPVSRARWQLEGCSG